MTEIFSVVMYTNQTNTIGLIHHVLANSEFRIAGISDSVEEVRKLLSQFAADFLIIDMVGDCENLNQSIFQLKIASPRTRILVMQKECDRENIFNSIKAGANIFLPADLDLDGLPQMLLSLSAGELFLPSFVAASILENINSESETNTMFTANITERERSILQCFSQGVSQSKAADILGVPENTVISIMNNIIQKIHFMDIAEKSYDTFMGGLSSEFELT